MGQENDLLGDEHGPPGRSDDGLGSPPAQEPPTTFEDAIQQEAEGMNSVPLTDQRPVSFLGWGAAVAIGLLCWIGLAKLLGF